jgi:hypothetical protein
MTMSRLQKKIADKFMRMTIYWHTRNVFEKDNTITVDKVIADINSASLDKLLSQGYTIEAIKEMAKEAIERCKGKK